MNFSKYAISFVRMREQRHPWMVEGQHQYLLAYKTILSFLKEILGPTHNVVDEVMKILRMT